MSHSRKQTGLIVVIIVLGSLAVNSAYTFVQTSVNATRNPGRELTVSAQTPVNILGSALSLPRCVTANAASFMDTRVARLDWGSELHPGMRYEIFFCIGNIGAKSGTIHVVVSNRGNGAEVSEVTVSRANPSNAGNITFSPLDGSTLAISGVVAAHVELDALPLTHGTHASLNSQIILSIGP